MFRRVLIALTACMLAAAPAMAEELETESADVLEVEGEIYSIKIRSAEIIEEADNYCDPVTPDKGDVFLVVNFEAKNISDADDYFNRLNFIAYADDFEVEQTDYMLPDDPDMMTGDIVAGKGLRGYLIFAVPEDWETFEVYYEETFGADKLMLGFTSDSEVFD